MRRGGRGLLPGSEKQGWVHLHQAAASLHRCTCLYTYTHTYMGVAPPIYTCMLIIPRDP